MENFGNFPAKSLIISAGSESKRVRLWKKCLLSWTFETTKVDLTGWLVPLGCPRLEAALLQHAGRNQFLLDVTLQSLDQEFAEVGSLRLGPRDAGETFYRSAKHLRGQHARVT